ncbi:tetratricopeptide repeat protein [Endozoicomonas sp. SM1973]|uniref:Tetratricopeptide repeat protein n=1 Tax=Spartinivicinus marinus TaxID=2994442 RepID=A0A853I3Y7_9GAMM|nr:tetratricopeptide repeat protein [Spartinivicinus marinus]MCX4028102.1 tetratricopeptide repeat protein [Spartinivicinus marinus]NYZ66222.1 tetratricopeptide repeat protein [Spartinivicinus marinus]
MNNYFRVKHFLASGLIISLFGCSGIKPQNNTNNQATVEPATEATTPISKDTLFALLVAEVAANRGQLDITLGNYLREAHKTQDPGVAERAYQISQYLGESRGALIASTIWANNDPDNSQAIQANAIELGKAGQLNAAAERMRELLEKNGGETKFDILAINAINLTQDDRDKLLATYDTIAKEYPNNLEIKFGQATLLHQSERHEEALPLTNQVIAKQPNYTRALILKGRLLSALKKDQQALDFLEKQIKKHPDNRRIRLLYARLLIQANQLTKAKQQFEYLVSQTPDDDTLLYSLSIISFESKLYDQAKRYFQKLLATNKRNDVAHYYLGAIAEQQNTPQAAIHHFEQIKPGQYLFDAFKRIALLLTKQGESAEARKRLKAARQAYPKFAPELYIIESEVLAQQKRYKDARKLLNQALKKHKSHTRLLYARAMISEKLNQIDKLEKDLRKIISVQPNHALALNALGYTLADRTNRYQEAKELITKAYQLTPNDPAVVDSMGWIEFKLGNLEDAIKFLRQAYQAFPDHEVAAHLGEVLWTSGKQEEALSIWNEALKEQPSSEIIKKTMRRLTGKP